ncbi:hypothetical protein CASFOL_027481 [Castilleja foliolosa]|uniref:Uncharacterized protein n=1 Tax=Castilleja foliolosa TaxID=1961234 RepID=A0ABD3CI49_9LAMI
MAVRQRAVTTLPTLMRALKKEASTHQPTALPSLRRAFSLYDQINIIDDVPEDQLRFQQFDDTWFKVNGVKYEGNLLCVGNLIMSWAPQKFSDITVESLSIFKTLRPIPDYIGRVEKNSLRSTSTGKQLRKVLSLPRLLQLESTYLTMTLINPDLPQTVDHVNRLRELPPMQTTGMNEPMVTLDLSLTNQQNIQ